MAIYEPNFSTFKRGIQEDEWVIFLKKFGGCATLMSRNTKEVGILTRLVYNETSL
jgi:hypothetical protein